MTTENEDRRNVYQYVLDSLALIEERGLSLSKAFALLASTDVSMQQRLEELSETEEHREEADEMKEAFHAIGVRRSMFSMIANFLETDLSNNAWFPYLEEGCDCCTELDEVGSDE